MTIPERTEVRHVRASTEDRVLEAYYADVRDGDLLEQSTERALFIAYRTCVCGYRYDAGATQRACPTCKTARNFAARDRIVKGALRFVLKVAKDYARLAKGASHDSELLKALTSAGNWGLLLAVDKFDPDRGTRFLTYAAWWIREKIYEELDSMGLVRVPAYRQKALRAKRKQSDSTELDPALVTIENLLVADTHQQDERLERDLVNTYGTDLIHAAMNKLGFRGRDKYVVLSYFGVREEPKNLRQIANRLSLSSEMVRLIKRDALEQLRVLLEQMRIGASYDVFTE